MMEAMRRASKAAHSTQAVWIGGDGDLDSLSLYVCVWASQAYSNKKKEPRNRKMKFSSKHIYIKPSLTQYDESARRDAFFSVYTLLHNHMDMSKWEWMGKQHKNETKTFLVVLEEKPRIRKLLCSCSYKPTLPKISLNKLTLSFH